eukprot:scpid81658/ scgid14682/ 
MERSSKSKRAPIQAEKCTDRASAPTPVPANGAYSAPTTWSDRPQASTEIPRVGREEASPSSAYMYMGWMTSRRVGTIAMLMVPLLLLVIAVQHAYLSESRSECKRLENENQHLRRSIERRNANWTEDRNRIDQEFMEIAHAYATNIAVLHEWSNESLDLIRRGTEASSKLIAQLILLERCKDQAVRFLKSRNYQFPEESAVKVWASKLPLGHDIPQHFISLLQYEDVSRTYDICKIPVGRSHLSSFLLFISRLVDRFWQDPFEDGRFPWIGFIISLLYHMCFFAFAIITCMLWDIVIYQGQVNVKTSEGYIINSTSFRLNFLWTVFVIAFIVSIFPIYASVLLKLMGEFFFIAQLIILLYFCSRSKSHKAKYACRLLKMPNVYEENRACSLWQTAHYFRIRANRRYLKRFQLRAVRAGNNAQ